MYIIIAGAGLIGQQLTKMLVENKHDVVVIDIDKEVCEFVYSQTGAMTINGSATDIRILEEAGAKKADVLVCLMRNDADNIACALIAKSLGVPRIIVRMRNPKYEQAYNLSGVTTIVRLADLLLNLIIMEIEQPKVKKISVLGGGKAEIYAIKIPKKAKSIGKKIKELAQNKNFPKECVIVGIYREDTDDFLIPRGDHIIMENDTVFLVSKSQYIKKAAHVLTKT